VSISLKACSDVFGQLGSQLSPCKVSSCPSAYHSLTDTDVSCAILTELLYLLQLETLR
jgi:hypothetical protein